MDENTSNWSRERVLKYIYHGLCGFAALGFTIFCVHLYVLDEDVAQIEFKEFNRDNEHIYPTVTLCFRHPLLGEKLLKFGEGINVSTYTSFLIGDLWDNRMAQIDYDDVSIDIENYLLGNQSIHIEILIYFIIRLNLCINGYVQLIKYRIFNRH